MKKIIRIFALILFILFVFGITTSQAKLTVTSSKTSSEMISELKKTNGYLTGISNTVRMSNPYLYCRQRGQHISSTAKYILTDEVSYPQGNSTNGYARAYILSASGYGDNKSNGLRQYAWWQILGQESGENSLLTIAKEYQRYKKNESNVTVNNSDATTTVSGNTLIYGPVKVTYSYGSKTSGSYSDKWGGFDYAFFNGSEKITSGVTLCTLETNGRYKAITTDGTSGNYNKVRTSIYNNKKLYVEVNLSEVKGVNSVNLKIRENKVDYSATAYNITGEYIVNNTYTVYCSVCEDKINNAKEIKSLENYTTEEDYKNIVNKLNEGDLVCFNKKYYRYDGYSFRKFSSSNLDYFDKLNFDGTVYDTKIRSLSEYYKTINDGKKVLYWIYQYNYNFSEFEDCGCAKTIYKGDKEESQRLFVVETDSETSKLNKSNITIPLTTSIKVTKKWEDYSNEYKIRPDTVTLKVYRSTNQTDWTKLTKGTDYTITSWTKNGNTWTATINGLAINNNSGKLYYYKVEEADTTYYDVKSYSTTSIKADVQDKNVTITNKLEKIDISGYVWLDEEEGVKPATAPDGNYDNGEDKMEGIKVYLYYKNPGTGETSKKAETTTDVNGYYKFKDYEIGNYYVKFEYDGINYEDTKEGGDSKAFDVKRDDFNNRFKTITYGKSNDGTTLNYNYSDNKSTLITKNADGSVKEEFIMNAKSTLKLYTSNVNDINLGLVERGTDIALSTDLSTAEVKINGQTTEYEYNKVDNTIKIGNAQTSETVSYNLNLYASDYNYRIRNYVSNSEFKENDYINEEIPEGTKTGNELEVFTTYELNLQNQGAKTTRINKVKYTFAENYEFKEIEENINYTTKVSGNTITITFTNGLELKDGETKTLHLSFKVKNNNAGVILGDFINKAEITSYSTDEGLIDVDSAPGNFISDNKNEDDNDTAGVLKIKLAEETIRKITGKVFNSDNNQNVNDVIVQLIELKTVNNKVYEYIWQETVSGSGKGSRLNAAGTALEEYTYTRDDGKYEFTGFIPGDYIVRFIYGDGTTYDMTENVIKYNGQDYKSAKDSNYNKEWYNSSSYTQSASVARDNEARRLETMAYSVEIDASKGVLLKLLNNVTVEDLNETEKEVVVSTYNKLYNPDITVVTTDVINKLLKEQVLKNTWMCAETSKIKVAVDTENINNTNTTTTVNGITKVYVEEIPNINFGLELRPETKIELKKYITGFKLVAANGQTLVNAYIDVNEYLNDPTDISNKVQGIRDNVTILDTVWQYEVAPTDINTIVDGASLEFEYTLVVKNTGDTDYLSTILTDAYKNKSTAEYIEQLTTKAREIKGYMKTGTYANNIGKAVGNSYYVGGTGSSKVLTEVTNIRDYVNNDLRFVTGSGDVEVDVPASGKQYRILRDDHTMQQATINTVLKTTRPTGKMENDGTAVIYKVTLGKNPISSTGNLNFENYIAEVMSYTNAAGRRAITSTPGNAEIIDHEHRTGKAHEIDEADTARIQVGVATGKDEKTNYIIIIAVVAGIAVIAAGAFVVKKYVIK